MLTVNRQEKRLIASPGKRGQDLDLNYEIVDYM